MTARFRPAFFLAVSLTACRKHIPVEPVAPLAPPACTARDAPALTPPVARTLVPGVRDPDLAARETYSFTPHACLVTARARMDYPLAVTVDLEVVYDAHFAPLHVTKRTTLPNRGNEAADVRTYELRASDPVITHRTAAGAVTYERLEPTLRRSDTIRTGPPRAVIAQGRGLLTAWLRRAHLAPGQQVREMVIDVREAIEVLRPATLKREPDQFVSALGRTVRVYTIYGREPVFADESDAVVGDMAGIVTANTVPDALPPLPDDTAH